MKKYKTTPELLAKISEVFEANRPCANLSPLDTVVSILQEGRHYGWAGIYIAVDSSGRAAQVPAKIELAETRSKILVSMKLSGREYGILSVESERKTFRPEDRVFLERVAHLGARFLAGPGRYLVRAARRSALAEKAEAAAA
ncbi:MAG TPA: GAF domain-containing protein [Terriglobales bacterium]|nr:GAF domain-containing protein [Terriglobales bacterium]